MTILITGAAQGIGRAIATAFAHTDNTLVLVDLNEKELSVLDHELSKVTFKVKSYAADLVNDAARKHMVQDVIALLGSPDVIINNAGVTHTPKPIYEISDQEFDFNFNVNVKAPFQLMKAFLPEMITRGTGWIINMASTANIDGYENLSVYAATKAALSSLTDSVAQEVKHTQIKAVAILPARTNTPMQVKVRGTEIASQSQPPSKVAEIIRRIVEGEIPVNNGDDVQVKDGEYVVEERIGKAVF